MSQYVMSAPMKAKVRQYGLDPDAVKEATGRVYTMISQWQDHSEYEREAELEALIAGKPCLVDLWSSIGTFDPKGTLLFQAAHSGCAPAIRLMLQTDMMAYSTPDMRMDTALLQAIRHHHEQAALLLVEAGIGINYQSRNRRTSPLHATLTYDTPNVFHALLERDDVNLELRNIDGDTPLFKAPAWALKALIDRGANPNVANNKGFTPLYIAYTKHDMVGFKTLLDSGADMTLPIGGRSFREQADDFIARRVPGGSDLSAAMMSVFDKEWQSRWRTATQSWESFISGKLTPMDVTLEHLYQWATIGKAGEMFGDKAWKQPDAAAHAGALMDHKMAPYLQELCVFDRAKLSRFAAQVTAPAHQGKVGDTERVRGDT